MKSQKLIKIRLAKLQEECRFPWELRRDYYESLQKEIRTLKWVLE